MFAQFQKLFLKETIDNSISYQVLFSFGGPILCVLS